MNKLLVLYGKKKVLTLNDRVFFLDKYDIEKITKKKKKIELRECDIQS